MSFLHGRIINKFPLYIHGLQATGLNMANNPKKRQGSRGDCVPKRPRRSAEGIRSKKESDRQRRKTRICLGVAFPRWRALKAKVGVRADTDLALLLLDR